MTEIQARAPLWQRIHDTLAADIDAGRYAAGAKLPTEAELAQRFGVNRHTVRRALEGLREAARIHVRRGAGAYVTQGRVDYALGPRTRFTQTLSELGHTPSRRLIRIETLLADAQDAAHLALPAGAEVHIAESVGEADGVPLIYSRMAFPAARLPGLPRALAATGSITQGLAACGIADYRRLWTRLIAETPGPMIARHLKMPESHAVLRSESLNVDPMGAPLEYGRSWFCSDRVQLVVGSPPQG